MSPPRKGFRTCQRCKKNRAERFFSSSRARFCSTCLKKKRSKGAHEQRVMKTYGLKAGEYDKLLAAQGGVCAICKKSRRGNFDVDHDHKTGLVRGLLCPADNRKVLKYARNDPERLRRAADYLESPPAPKILGIRIHKDNRED